MSTQWQPALPPVPNSSDVTEMAMFMLAQSPREVAELIEGVCAAGAALIDGCIDVLLEGLKHAATEHVDHVVAIAGFLAESRIPLARAQVPELFRHLLCRGIEQMERTAWDQLLQDRDDFVFRVSYMKLYDLVNSAYSRTGASGISDLAWTTESYDHMFGLKRWPERLMHYLKLGRVRERMNALEDEHPGDRMTGSRACPIR